MRWSGAGVSATRTARRPPQTSPEHTHVVPLLAPGVAQAIAGGSWGFRTEGQGAVVARGRRTVRVAGTPAPTAVREPPVDDAWSLQAAAGFLIGEIASHGDHSLVTL